MTSVQQQQKTLARLQGCSTFRRLYMIRCLCFGVVDIEDESHTQLSTYKERAVLLRLSLFTHKTHDVN